MAEYPLHLCVVVNMMKGKRLKFRKKTFTGKHHFDTDFQLAKAILELTVLFQVASPFSMVIWLGTTVLFPVVMPFFLVGKDCNNETLLFKDHHRENNSYHSFIYNWIIKSLFSKTDTVF